MIIVTVHWAVAGMSQVFEEVAGIEGVDMDHFHLYDDSDDEWGTGAAWLDYDQHGDLDLYVSNRAEDNHFYENQLIEGGQGFLDVTDQVNLACTFCDGAGVSVADYNNDGYPDIYLATAQGDVLYENQNGSFFLDVSHKLNDISLLTRGTTVSWIDFDQDGWLDLYLSNHVPAKYLPVSQYDTLDYLLRNVGGVEFEDASFLIDAFDQRWGSSFAAGWTDYDNDDDFDLIVTNDCFGAWITPTIVYENKGPTGSNWTSWEFDTVMSEIGVVYCASAMGIAVGDINRDGYMDFAYSNIGSMRLFRNIGGEFIEDAEVAGVSGQVESHFSWGIHIDDMDLDGWEDILLVSGVLSLEGTAGDAPIEQPNYYFQNNGLVDNGEKFTDLSMAANFDDVTRARTSIVGDYDNDGDLDVFIVNYNATAQLKRNNMTSGNHYLVIDLQGVISNTDGIGTKIQLHSADGSIQYREGRSGGSLGGGNSPYIHFGLGSTDVIDSIVLDWPSGVHQVLTGVPVDTFLTVIEEQILSSESIELAGFKQGSQAVLIWSSNGLEMEYVVEHSVDGQNFEQKSRYFSNEVFKCEYKDISPKSGRNFYRIRQGGVFSNVVEVFFEPKQSLEVYPTIWDDGGLYYKRPHGGLMQYRLRGSSGAVWASGVIESQCGRFDSLMGIDMPAGVYFLEVYNPSIFNVVKLIKS